MVQGLSFLIFIVFLIGIYFLYSWSSRKSKEENLAIELIEISQKNTSKIQELLSLYLDVVLMHGPDSVEARAFRFGVESNEIWEEKKDSLRAYGTIVEIVDKAIRRKIKGKNNEN